MLVNLLESDFYFHNTDLAELKVLVPADQQDLDASYPYTQSKTAELYTGK